MGLWIGFDVVTGVAFAGGAFVLTFIVYILNNQKYHSIVRITVLNGFLAYVFYAGALLLDLGRPWNVINPIIGNNFGVSSVLFLVAWHFLLYMLAQLIEFSPAIAEWLGAGRARKILSGMTIAAVILASPYQPCTSPDWVNFTSWQKTKSTPFGILSLSLFCF